MKSPRLRQAALAVLLLTVASVVIATYSSRRAHYAGAVEPEPMRYSRYVDAEGNIGLPSDYDTTFLHLGTFAVATKPDGPTDEIHGVYARGEDVEAYRRDGEFPDGAVIVKDVYRTVSANLTTGHASWAKDVKVWFVMIKDAQGRFPGNDLWGDGWGWALFDGKDPKKQIATDYRTDCRSCHIPAKKDDWLYVRGYPLLQK